MNQPPNWPYTAIPGELAFYASPPHECSYLAGREAVTLFADPHAPLDPTVYSALADLGFRRSGDYVYRPQCPDCDACRSVRVPVDAFRPDRSQRRCARDNADLTVTVQPAGFSDEHFALYRRYLDSRHPDDSMQTEDPGRYMEFLTSGWSDTRFVEFRQDERLLMVAVVDLLRHGLSAVYTFFEPEEAKRGLGSYAVLWEIEETWRRQLPYLYLGYWIEESPKMAYKRRFRPLEAFDAHGWRLLDT